MMVAVGVLGLLLFLQLCSGDSSVLGTAVGQGTTPYSTQPPAALSTLPAAGTWELRLVNGGARCAGRVEVKHEGEWGSVCVSDYHWESKWDAVVCKSLGCGRVVHSSVYAPFGQGTGRIWLHVFCRGSEMLLQDCIHLDWGNHYCDHDTDVGVTCEDALELRLADGGGPCAGRVEVKLRGRWGTVGDDNWNMDNAEVVCQQLGCGSATGAYTASTLFGKGTGSISLTRVDCQGNETALWYCKIYGWGPYRGTHNYDTAVTCQGFSRLVGSNMACAGRLEVRQGRTWTRVCEGDVDIKAAQVVCRELGCGPALAVPGAGWFEAGMGQFWQGGFKCTGTEPLLSACARQLPRSEGCTGHATIICSSYTGFRLAGNSSSCAGRVEVEAGGSWGSLCASDWDLFEAHVFCHHFGCGPAVTVPPGGYFGGEDGLLRRDTFSCSGSEHHPGQCPTVVLGQPACLPGHAAAINCSGLYHTCFRGLLGHPRNQEQGPEGVAEPLRLVEGESRCDGRLEVATSLGAWARVPAGLWDNQGASVVCRQLGCGVPEKVYTVPGSSPAALQGLWCAGTEHSLAQCNVSGMAAVPTGSPEEVAVVCSGSRRVMLVGGTGRCAGRVEVYINGTWGSICQDAWDLSDATVVCRQLGCGTALEAPGSAPFGPGTGPLWLDAGGCAGTEASLWDCPALAPRVCRRGGGAGAVCSEHLSLRLTGGSNRCSGHLEVLHNGTWGRVCANGTSAATATIVCRQLGCGDGGTLMDAPIWDPAPAWLSWVDCEEGSRLLWQCPSAPWHLHTCSLSGDAYVTCHQDSNDASGTPTPSPGVPSSRAPLAAAGTVSVPTVLCVVLGTLLFLTLGVLAVQVCCARACPG
ncbi:scavenger receptor cysteine-rich type 1 protein M130-like [Porphyrio hochstetteri]